MPSVPGKPSSITGLFSPPIISNKGFSSENPSMIYVGFHNLPSNFSAFLCTKACFTLTTPKTAKSPLASGKIECVPFSNESAYTLTGGNPVMVTPF